MRKLVQGTCLVAAMAAMGYGQTFEVASVKVSQLFRQGGEGSRRSDVQVIAGNVAMRNVGMQQALMWAYKVTGFQLTNAPNGDSERYDIIAKAAGPAKTDDMRVMMQALLAERFKLAVHRETKEMQAYALIEAKGGHKLKEAEAGDGPGVTPIEERGKIALAGQKASLDQLCAFLSQPLRTPVVDMTGLKGKFDFTFDLSNYIVPGPSANPGEPPPDPVAILQMALPKQLGLKLEARKLPIEMLIIDHIEKAPVEN